MRSSSTLGPMPGRRLVCLTVAVLALTGVATGTAAAQDAGVQVDPESPAGKEYALPLDSARRDAAGAAAPYNAAEPGPPLFGTGISARAAADDEADPNEAGDRGRGSKVRPGERPETAPATPGAIAAARSTDDAAAGGLSASVATAAIALGVLLVGGLVGLSVRAARRGDPASR